MVGAANPSSSSRYLPSSGRSRSELGSTNPATSLTVATGRVPSSSVRVQVSGTRADFFINPAEKQGLDFPVFTDISAAITDMRNRLADGSNLIGAVNRLAMVVNVSEVVPSVGDANNLISQQVGLTLPFPDASDVLFQVNRRMELQTVAGLRINRILKWLVENFQVVEVGSGPPNVRSIDVATMSVDVNIVPVQGRSFMAAEQATIFQAIGTEVERLCQLRTIAALQ